MRSLREEEAPPPRQGLVLSVFGAKGGSGATTLAVNLAGLAHAERSRPSTRVLLVDLDLQTGDVLTHLDLACRFTLADALHERSALRAEQLPHLLPRHASGISVLAQPDQGHSELPTGPMLAELFGLLRRAFDLIVVDGLRDLGAATIAALDQSDRVLFVLTSDGPALKSGRRSLDMLRQLGLAGRIKVVLNRWHPTALADDQAAAHDLGAPIDARVDNDFPTVIAAANQGRLLLDSAPEAAVTSALRALTRQVVLRPKRRTSETLTGLLAPVAGDR